MGERKGQNFYYPPDFDPKKHGSLNGYHGVHALRERANKLDQGILIIRFEMPYNIWCDGCKNHIGMGVRYNAEKTKIGMYYTTPVYQFRMKCYLCNNKFDIKTDPANLDYVIVQGATRQERRWDPTENGQVVPDDKQVGRKLADDAMYKLEHGSKDTGKAKDAAPRLASLSSIQDRVKDDYLANRILRDQFRANKKEHKAQAEIDNRLLSKASLDMDLVEEREEDVRMAQLLTIQASQSSEERQQDTREHIEARSIFQKKEKNKGRISVGGKQQSLDALRKIVKKKQNNLVKGKGFGIVVKRKIDKTEIDKSDNTEVALVMEMDNSEGKRDDNEYQDTLEKETDHNLQHEDKNKIVTNSKNTLSLLSCDYGSSGSESE